MDKFYYYSKTKLKLIEIRNFSRKFLVLFIISVFLVSSVLFGGYFLIKSILDPDSQLYSLKAENRELIDKVKEISSLYEKLNNDVDSLVKANNELRLVSDLPQVNIDRTFGTGGGVFKNVLNIAAQNSKIDLEGLSDYIENIKNKISFEKSYYSEISKKLKTNESLYASIPALKPSSGVVAEHGFGMRIHPILKVNRMHEGIDIITDTGTPVVSPGNGVISFVGTKGGFGLCIEIDHGFGYRTILGHLSQADVNVGQNISRGQYIAKTGNSGLTSGPHLHYEVHHDGIALDPSGFIFDDLSLFESAAKN